MSHVTGWAYTCMLYMYTCALLAVPLGIHPCRAVPFSLALERPRRPTPTRAHPHTHTPAHPRTRAPGHPHTSTPAHPHTYKGTPVHRYT
eukprot:3270725-Alexandrium_andersonii.AAC.1